MRFLSDRRFPTRCTSAETERATTAERAELAQRSNARATADLAGERADARATGDLATLRERDRSDARAHRSEHLAWRQCRRETRGATLGGRCGEHRDRGLLKPTTEKQEIGPWDDCAGEVKNTKALGNGKTSARKHILARGTEAALN